jgi:CRISPR/Cas system-associated protein Cas7 (RAMP superfamily)
MMHIIKAGKDSLIPLVKFFGLNISKREHPFSKNMMYTKSSGANITAGSFVRIPITTGIK